MLRVTIRTAYAETLENLLAWCREGAGRRATFGAGVLVLEYRYHGADAYREPVDEF